MLVELRLGVEPGACVVEIDVAARVEPRVLRSAELGKQEVVRGVRLGSATGFIGWSRCAGFEGRQAPRGRRRACSVRQPPASWRCCASLDPRRSSANGQASPGTASRCTIIWPDPMCRVLAYLGRPLPLADVLYETDNSLVRQAHDPKMTAVMNLAGFGFAAWDEIVPPGRAVRLPLDDASRLRPQPSRPGGEARTELPPGARARGRALRLGARERGESPSVPSAGRERHVRAQRPPARVRTDAFLPRPATSGRTCRSGSRG